MDGPARGVDLEGAKYPLRDAEVRPSWPIGVSNEWASEAARITVREGILAVVLSRMPAPEGDAL